MHQVLCDDVIICNAVESIDWSDLPIQFFLCEDCLIPGCGGGGRVTIRYCNGEILIIPDFNAMLQGAWEETEYAPPPWMKKRGCLSFLPEHWNRLRSFCPAAPSLNAILPITTEELLRLYHFQSPRAFLPDYLTPTHVKWDLILCTNGPDSSADISNLKHLFSDPTSVSGHVFCIPAPDSYPVSAFLDLPSIAEWPIFSSEPEPVVSLSNTIHIKFLNTD